YWCDLGAETLHVVDFKYGHRFVDAFRNWQLLAYAEGAREHSQWRPKRISMTIYQPRNYDRSGPWRTWEITADEHDYYVEQMHLGAKLVSPNAAARTGEACRDCSGRAGCEALQRSAMSIVDYTHEATGDDLPDGPLGKELSLLLAAQDRLKARSDGHDYYVEQMHLGAKLVPPNAAARTGEACRDCSGRAGCEALQRSAMSIVDYTHEATGDDLPDGPLGKELSLLLAAQDRLKA